MTILYIDIHSHLNLSPLSETKEAVLARMREEGIATITVGTSLETSRTAVAIADENPGVCFATVGIHPTETANMPREDIDTAMAAFAELVLNPNVVAIGETGLDYFWEKTDEGKNLQKDVFKMHIDLAAQSGKPLMLHVRASKGTDDAYYDALEILGQYPLGLAEPRPLPLKGGDSNSGLRANFHFFSGSKECMKKIVEAGYFVSVDGPITFSSDYDEMICAVPIDRIMAETDAPFAAPAPYRGKTCEPWMVVEVVKKIAELKGLDIQEVREQLLKNSSDFFGIKIA